MPLENRVALIAGPTGGGKSVLALGLARRTGGTIVNADALQVYRELRILTARPADAETAEVPHRLFGYVAAAEGHSVGRWLADARDVLEDVWRAGRLAIVTGGTGLYFKALEEGLAEIPPIPAAIRVRWREKMLGHDIKALYEILKIKSETEARRIDPMDGQRIARSLEVLDATGRPLAEWHAEAKARTPLAGCAIARVALVPPREELYARCEARFDAMLEAGAMDEARALAGLDPALPAMKAIGVAELLAVDAGTMTLDDACLLVKRNTRRYAKRQMTWIRGRMRGWPLAASVDDAFRQLATAIQAPAGPRDWASGRDR